MRIEDELREYTAQPSEAAWERFRAGRAAAGGADELRGAAGADPAFGAAAAERRPRERRLSPWWWSAAASAAVLVGAWWGIQTPNPITTANPVLVPQAAPANADSFTAPIAAQSTVRAIRIVSKPTGTSGSLFTATASAARKPHSDSVSLAPSASLAVVEASVPVVVENASPGLKQAFSEPSHAAVSPAGRVGEPSAPAETGWIHWNVAWENGNPYRWPDLPKTTEPDRWGRTALVFAQKQWERLRRGEKLVDRIPVPEELTVTLDLKKVGQRLALPAIPKSENRRNEP